MNMQREIKHTHPLPPGKCGHVPRHYRDERLVSDRHKLECRQCSAETGWMPTLQNALAQWSGAAQTEVTGIWRKAK